MHDANGSQSVSDPGENGAEPTDLSARGRRRCLPGAGAVGPAYQAQGVSWEDGKFWRQMEVTAAQQCDVFSAPELDT